MIPMEGRIHGVEDILLGFGPKDAGSIPAGSVFVIIVAGFSLPWIRPFYTGILGTTSFMESIDGFGTANRD